MEALPIAIAVLLGIFFFFLIIVAISRKKRHLSGENGEIKVSKLLNKLKREGEFVINDYLASRNKDGTDSIQIDHIFFSHKGIFVIETKDYGGRIYGSRYQNSWTQSIGYERIQRHLLYNPVKQNETHINYVKHLFKKDLPIYNVVIFLKADISAIKDCSDVLFDKKSFSTWYGFLPNNRLDDLMIRGAYQTLLLEMRNHPISKAEHINNVHRRHGIN